tara:strand:+ start:386 stop:1693 length:1308 start_codon:yes stop_codon:yes gene_type:complete
MANGIDRRYTGIPMIPQVVEEKTSMWDAIVPLAQMAKAEKARQDALELKWEGIRQVDEEAADLKQYRSDDLAQKKVYQDGQIGVAEEANKIKRAAVAKAKAEEEYAKEKQGIDWMPSHDVTTATAKAEKYLELADAYPGNEQLRTLAETMVNNAVEKKSLTKMKKNMYGENNPWKIKDLMNNPEYDQMTRHWPGADEFLQRKVTRLEKEYAIEDAAVLKHPAYESRLATVTTNMKNPDGTFKKDEAGNPYTAHTFGMAIEQAKAVTATEMQTRLTAQGLYPPTQDVLDEIWANPVAKDLWLESPLDDPNVIWEKVGVESGAGKTETEIKTEAEVTPKKWAERDFDKDFDRDFAQWSTLGSGSRTGGQEKLMGSLNKQLVGRIEDMSEAEQLSLIKSLSEKELDRLQDLSGGFKYWKDYDQKRKFDDAILKAKGVI